MLHRMSNVGLLILGVVVGCSSNPQRCANAEPDFITSTGCVLGGGYDAALEEQRASLLSLQDQIEFTNDELVAIDDLAEELAGNANLYRRDIDKREIELSALRAQIEQLSPDIERQNINRESMLRELDELTTLLNDARDSGQAEKQQIRLLTLEVERRRKVIDSLAKSVPVE